MTQNLKSLLETSEKIRENQKKIILKQQQQISCLEDVNSNLKTRLTELQHYADELTADYSEVVSICKEQQNILDSLSKHK
ncbi:MAG: hypothetical protein Q4B70_14815 [Lachnospiraceae bacterium]|nr:hypothetical protein [Lachnospiraceae bacterium]